MARKLTQVELKSGIELRHRETGDEWWCSGEVTKFWQAPRRYMLGRIGEGVRVMTQDEVNERFERI